MTTLTMYRGLRVVSPDPTGDGGLAIQDDLRSLVDWSPKSVWAQETDPTVDDDETQDFFPGSLWLRTDTSPPALFLCEDSTEGAAVWNPVLLCVLQDSAPKLGGDLDVNGQQIVTESDGNIVLKPDGAGNVGVGTETPTTVLHVAGPLATAVATCSADHSVTSTDSVLLCNAASQAITLTLPSAAGIAGRQYTFKRVNAGANAVTVAAAATETIDGASTLVITTQYEHITIVSDGTNWWVI